MDPAIILAAVNGVLSLVNVVLPIIGGGNSAAIGTIIKTLQTVMPVAATVIPEVYKGVKNVIASVGAHPATTQDQMAALAELDKTADGLWDSIQAQFDPDAPGAS